MVNSKIKTILENFILVAILLVVIHTFLYEISIYYHWTIYARNILIFSGLIFDLIFSIEFFIRTIAASKIQEKGFLNYWFYERGWVDFLSSVPLLLLDSGPSVYILLSGAVAGGEGVIGTLNVLKVVKAIRVTRILRLVRILKIFGKIHNTDSKMAQHHTATLSTTIVFTVVLVLVFFSMFNDGNGTHEIEKRRIQYQHFLAETNSKNFNTIKSLFLADQFVLSFHKGKKVIFEKINSNTFNKSFSKDDYFIISKNGIDLTISSVDIHQRIASTHLQNFFIIIFIVISIMFIYTRHFAQNISDLIHILNKGFRKKDYNLQIKIKEEFKNEEIFKLAQFYNDAYLPAKLRRIHSEEEATSKIAFSMDDLTNFNK